MTERTQIATLLDAGTIETLRSLADDDDPDFLQDIAHTFLDDTRAQLRALGRMSDSGDIGRAAHGIKGAAANVGAKGVEDAARRLEHAASEGTSTAEPLAALEGVFERTEPALLESYGLTSARA